MAGSVVAGSTVGAQPRMGQRIAAGLERHCRRHLLNRLVNKYIGSEWREDDCFHERGSEWAAVVAMIFVFIAGFILGGVTVCITLVTFRGQSLLPRLRPPSRRWIIGTLKEQEKEKGNVLR